MVVGEEADGSGDMSENMVCSEREPTRARP